MKLEHGKSYKRGIIILFLVWALFSVLPLPNSPDNPALLGFALSVLGVVAYQAYSGVALDQPVDSSDQRCGAGRCGGSELAGPTAMKVILLKVAAWLSDLRVARLSQQ